MRIKIAAALLCTPLAANAQQLVVTYQGTVSSVDRASLAEEPPFAPGASISGSLTIELDRAPADEVADPRLGRYYGGSPGIDFILGTPHPEARTAGDLVLVYDDWFTEPGTAPQDGFLIHDRAFGEDGGSHLVLGLMRPASLGQLFSSDALAQTFEVESEPGTDLWGYIEHGFGELYRNVSFKLDWFSVGPRVCRI